MNRSDHFLMGDGDVSQLGSGFGFIGDFKGGRRGIVLKPDTYDGDSRVQGARSRGEAPRVPRGPWHSSCENGRAVDRAAAARRRR